MKNTKRLLSVVLVLAVLMGVTLTASGASLAESYSDMAARAQFEALSRAQADAVEASQVLYDSFLVLGGPVPIEHFPDNYGGCFIKDGILHINIMDLENADLAYYKTVMKGFESIIIFDNVEYSYNTLQAVADKIAEELIAAEFSLVISGVDVKRNAVSIKVLEDDLAQLNVNALYSAGDPIFIPAQNEYGVPVVFRISNGFTTFDPELEKTC